MRAADLLRRLDDEAFKPFRDWRTIALSHIVQFSDLKPAGNGRKKSRG